MLASSNGRFIRRDRFVIVGIARLFEKALMRKGRIATMRAVLQRVSSATVTVDSMVVGRIGTGWLVLLGVAKGDSDEDADRLAERVANLRGFEDDQGKMNRSVSAADGSVLVVSQFTLLADCRSGRRPSFTEAVEPAEAERLYLRFVEKIRNAGLKTETGKFRAMMDVELVNNGPVTFLLDSRKVF